MARPTNESRDAADPFGTLGVVRSLKRLTFHLNKQIEAESKTSDGVSASTVTAVLKLAERISEIEKGERDTLLAVLANQGKLKDAVSKERLDALIGRLLRAPKPRSAAK